MTSYFGRFFTHAGVLAVFKPRRGRLKIPVVPTGKLKLHVFPLRRAKENKGFSPLDTHKPLKRLDLNFIVTYNSAGCSVFSSLDSGFSSGTGGIGRANE